MRFRLAVLVAACGVGCGVDLAIPEDVTVNCESDAECPAGFTCSPVLKECIQPSSGVPPSASDVRIEPVVARRGTSLSVYFNTSEVLRRDPTVRLDDAAFRSLVPITPIAGFKYGFGTNDPDIVEGEYAIRAALTGGDGTVSQDVILGTARFDFTPPALAGASTVSERVVAGGRTASLHFSVTEPLLETPSARLAWATGESASADVSELTAQTFALAYPSNGAEPATPASLVVSLVDLAGNEATDTEAAVLSFDAVGPQLIDAVSRRRVLPDAVNPLLVVSRATHGTTVELFIAFDEPVIDDPDGTHYPLVRTSGPVELVFSESIAAGTTYVFNLTLGAGSYVDGTYDIEVLARDAVGNVSTAQLATRFDAGEAFADRLDFVIDTTPPAAPAVALPDRIIHQRAPWGGDGTLSSSRLVGGPGAIESCGAGEAVCPWVVAYAFANLAQAVELGRGHVGADGSFDFVYSGVDFPDVYITALDSAGNSSGAGGTATRVRDGVWLATFGNKTPETTAINPHRILRLPEPGVSGIRTQAGLTTEHDDYSQLAASDTVVTRVRPMDSWVARPALTSGFPPAVVYGEVAMMRSLGTLIQFGGVHQATSSIDHNEVWQESVAGWVQLHPVSGSPLARMGHGLVYDARRDRLVMFGGSNDFEANEPQDFDDLWEFDGSFWRERCDGSPLSDVCAERPGARMHFAITYDERGGRTVIFGGNREYAGGVYGDTWAWDGTAWSQILGGPSARDSSAMAYDGGRGNIVLFGGSSGASETWILNGTTWAQVFPATTPIAASGHKMVYDASRDRVTMVTGFTVNYDWDGINWTPRNLAPGVDDNRVAFGAAYDNVRNSTFLYGGDAGTNNSNELWSWNGTTNTLVTHGNTSIPAAGISVYDEGAGRTLLLTTSTFETWQFDGIAWRQLTMATHPAGPGAMTYDAGRNVAVFFGGVANNETWEFGTFGSCAPAEPRCWEQRTLAGAVPAARTRAALAYDRRRKRVVMHGGEDPAVAGNSTPLNTTFELGIQSQCGNALCWRSVSTGGPARFNHAMVYDELRGRTILWGGVTSTSSNGDACNGNDGSGCDELWEWSGYAWQLKTQTGDVPVGVSTPRATYDSRAGVSLFGYGQIAFGIGGGGTSQIKRLWSWDGTTWHEQHSIDLGQAAPDEKLSLAFDRARGELMGHGTTSWTRPSQGGRAASVLAFDWQRAAVPASAIVGIGLRIDGSSTSGPATLQRASVGGFEARLWNAYAGAWGTPQREPGPATRRLDLSVDGAAARRFIDGNGTFLAQVTSLQSGASSDVSVDLDYVELEVRYRLDATPVCGDGVINGEEVCDDGNATDDGNGCSAACARVGTCGDGVPQALFEECDTGSNSNVAADACRLNCTLARCGDGVVDSGETCDDGNVADSGNGCGGKCQRNDLCGDGVKTGVEACDDGDAIDDGRGCLADCTLDNCCSARATSGCAGGSGSIQACVCAINAACCGTAWTSACVTLVTTAGCGTCNW